MLFKIFIRIFLSYFPINKKGFTLDCRELILVTSNVKPFILKLEFLNYNVFPIFCASSATIFVSSTNCCTESCSGRLVMMS